MRIAFVVASVLVVVATPSEASKSCMSQSEARQRFASEHLYWHGPDHCWDATSPRHRQIQTQRKTPVQAAEQNSDRPKWRDSMSDQSSHASSCIRSAAFWPLPNLSPRRAP